MYDFATETYPTADDAVKALLNRNNTDEGVLFRDSSTPVFYSNAARAVEQVRQEKATPEQWLKMIEKNGGLKSGEDKWIGLSDWLKESKEGIKELLKDCWKRSRGKELLFQPPGSART